MEEKASLIFRKMDLNKLLYFSLLRFCGEQQEEKEELLKITNYQNEEGDFLLATLPKKRELDELLYALKNDALYDKLQTEISRSCFEDVFSLLEVCLRAFYYYDNHYINDRLQFFSLIQLLKKENTEHAFKYLLFFNPCGETFIDSNQLTKQGYLMDNIAIDIKEVFEKLFSAVFELKNKKECYYPIAKKDIECLYSLLKEMVYTIFGVQTLTLSQAVKTFFEIDEDREKLYLSLSKAIDFYKLVSFDNEDNSASHYYMRDYMGEEIPTIENKVCRSAKTKYKSECLIDSYFFKYTETPNEFIAFLGFLKAHNFQQYIKFSILLFSHPFIIFNWEFKRALCHSKIREVLPQGGYAMNLLDKLKAIL